MPRKVFNVTVEFDLHAVTCPGVWLCPKGKVSLRILMLDSSAETSDIEPAFPLLVHETFTFSHTFRHVRFLQDLAHLFSGLLLSIQLIQWAPSLTDGNILATFETSLEELLYPAPRCRALLPGVDVDLLMEPTQVFPGIIAPKMEVSTRTTIEEALASSLCGDGSSVFLKTLLSKTAGAQNKRQRRVCHTRGSKLPGRLGAPSCRVRRSQAVSARSSNGDGTPSSLSALQHLIWEATSRNLRGPLPETNHEIKLRCSNCHRDESLEAETGAGKPFRPHSSCYHEELTKAETAPLEEPRRSAGESRPSRSLGSQAQRNGSPTTNRTLRGQTQVKRSGFSLELKQTRSPRSNAARRDSPIARESRHSGTLRSTQCGSRPSSRSRMADGLQSCHSSRSPGRKSCLPCAREESSQRGGPSLVELRSKQDGGCCACAGRPVSTVRRFQDLNASLRTVLRSRRGAADVSYRESFYRNLEKFYKRLYDQAMERRNGCSC